MTKNSAISWTDHTWNPWMGCTKASAGCKNCYMFREMTAYGKNPNKVVRSKTTFNAPLKWTEPAKIFTCSWSDFFHEAVPLPWLDDAWDVIRRTPQHTYLILTKRPEMIHDSLPYDWGTGWPNVWLGVTIEDRANIYRLNILAEIPATLRFVSYEPALEPIADLLYAYTPVIDWVIGGGESGLNFRNSKMDWFLDVLDVCRDANIPYFHKQSGGSTKIDGVWGGEKLNGVVYHEFPIKKGRLAK